MFCPKCGTSNNDSAKFCLSCGNSLSTVTGGQSVSQDSIVNQEEFYKAAIGPKNQTYYLNRFLRFDEDGKTSGSWHWPAFFLTFYWFLYRKMWLNALVYFLLPYILLIPVGIISMMFGKGSEILVGIGYVIYMIAIFIVPPIYANALYYKHCKKKIAEVASSKTDVQRQLGEVSGKGGTSNVVLIFVLLFVFIAIIGILAAIAIPAYSDYTNRARTTQAVSIGKTATLAVTDYYDRHQEVPADLSEAGFTIPADTNMKSLAIDPSNGTITLTLANAALDGKSILFIPSLDSNKQITWRCMSQEIEARHLPKECRP